LVQAVHEECQNGWMHKYVRDSVPGV